MRFILYSTSYQNSYNPLHGYVPELQNEGFKIEDEQVVRTGSEGEEVIDHTYFIEIDSLEDLLRLSTITDTELVIDARVEQEQSIEIYDTWRE